MNIKIVKNKYINALFVLMFFSAIIHILVAFCLLIKSGNLYAVNYFNIIGIEDFIPNFLNSLSGNIVSLVFQVVFYIAILKINKAE